MENEISKHTLKIIKTMHDPKTPLRKKIAEVALEIFIIVFAVSLAQFLERQKEQSVKQKDVKEFLIGIKEDIQRDIQGTNENIEAYKHYKKVYTYLRDLKPSSHQPADTINKYFHETFSNSFLRPNTSRYEGFKSSGKLEDVEDKKLLHQILDYYQETLARIRTSELSYIENGSKLQDICIDQVIENDDGTNNYEKIILEPKYKNLCKALIPRAQLFERYNNVIAEGNDIIKQINNLYPKN